MISIKQVAAALVLATFAWAQTATVPPLPSGTGICTNGGNPNPNYSLNVATGYRAGSILKGLSTPRGITIDTEGHLLVVESRKGISIHTLGPDGCVLSSKTLVSATDLNHSIDISADGKTLYASSVEAAFKWTYDPVAMTATNKVTLITGMTHQDHTTRTLLLSKKYPGLLIVSRGSNDNLDMAAAQSSTGRAIVKIFNLTQLASGSVNYASGGTVFGYGLRNDVGLVEDNAGNIWSVENSADDMKRSGTDVHTDNPGEPMWNLGDPSKPTGFYGGYPYCFMVWQPSLFRDKTFKSGDWFVQSPNNTVNDDWCGTNTGKKPSFILPAHTAPLDIKFGVGSDTAAYVSLHGSWDRQPPQGYKVVKVPGKFDATGAWAPDAAVTNTAGYSQFLWNRNEGSCSTGCFRPVGLVFDKTGTMLYVSSDTSGEVLLDQEGFLTAYHNRLNVPHFVDVRIKNLLCH